ncbi:MAG: hypothetical protein JNL60_05325 [Bacteroidia bacterium]|nr:hypothetical protein [Bacteroidia bacterium]
METKETNKPSQPQKIMSQRLKRVEAHNKTAQNLEEAAKNYFTAAKYLQAGNEEFASEHTLKAKGHILIAAELQEEYIKLPVIAD